MSNVCDLYRLKNIPHKHLIFETGHSTVLSKQYLEAKDNHFQRTNTRFLKCSSCSNPAIALYDKDGGICGKCFLKSYGAIKCSCNKQKWCVICGDENIHMIHLPIDGGPLVCYRDRCLMPLGFRNSCYGVWGIPCRCSFVSLNMLRTHLPDDLINLIIQILPTLPRPYQFSADLQDLTDGCVVCHRDTKTSISWSSQKSISSHVCGLDFNKVISIWA